MEIEKKLASEEAVIESALGKLVLDINTFNGLHNGKFNTFYESAVRIANKDFINSAIDEPEIAAALSSSETTLNIPAIKDRVTNSRVEFLNQYYNKEKVIGILKDYVTEYVLSKIND